MNERPVVVENVSRKPGKRSVWAALGLAGALATAPQPAQAGEINVDRLLGGVLNGAAQEYDRKQREKAWREEQRQRAELQAESERQRAQRQAEAEIRQAALRRQETLLQACVQQEQARTQAMLQGRVAEGGDIRKCDDYAQ